MRSDRRHNSNWLARLEGACLILVVALAGGCKAPANVADAGTVNFLLEFMPANLDPRIGTDAQSQDLDGLLFDSLVATNAQMDIVPDLAQSWDIPDPRTYVFHLRRGVKFHNGQPLTSADVKFTFDSVISGAVKSAKRGTKR